MKIEIRQIAYTVVLFAAALIVPSASAGIIQPTATLPPTAGFYALADTCIAPICLANITIGNFVVLVSMISGGDQLTESNVTLNADGFQNISGTPGASLGHIVLTGQIDISYFGRSSPTMLGTFNAEITDLDISGTFNGHTAVAHLNAANPSTGVTTVSRVGDDFVIDSFFDVFAELSVDGGPFIPGPPRHADLAAVPEPGTLGLVTVAFCVAASWKRFRRA